MEKDPKSRRGYINEARRVAGVFLRNNVQTIVFAQSRLNTEVLLTYLKEDIETAIQKEGLVRGYRGGYLPLKRREIKKGLREGKILGVVSTNAFELPFGDGETFGKLEIAGVLKFLEEEKLLHHSQDKWYWTSDANPADGVSEPDFRKLSPSPASSHPP